AEDGIRDRTVTGVQTCALPISLWLPFYQTWSKQCRVLVPTHPGFGQSGGFDEIDTIEDMAFHYVELLDTLGLEQVCLGGVSLGEIGRASCRERAERSAAG